jgi:dephospho-CoA kinase
VTDRGRAVRIGITGPIGCGKSTVAGWLGERPGVVVVDADLVARDVLEPGTREVEAVYGRFGDGLRSPDGTLDRAALGRIVFADPVGLRDLEAIVHPAVRPRILAQMEEADRAGAAAIVIEAIKLVEGGLAHLCDVVWLVTCRADVQLERLLGRGATAEDAAARIAAQAGFVDRLAPWATSVIETDGPKTAVREAVERAFVDVLTGRREGDRGT